MKKYVFQIVSLCVALFMLSVCGGVNIYHCCCDACTEHAYAILKSSDRGTHCVKHDAEREETAAKSCSCGNCAHSHDDASGVGLCNETAGCEVQHIEAPDFSNFNTTKVSFAAPLVGIVELIHNSQFIIHNYKRGVFCNNEVPIAHYLSGRVIIVRKSAYLI